MLSCQSVIDNKAIKGTDSEIEHTDAGRQSRDQEPVLCGEVMEVRAFKLYSDVTDFVL